MRLTVSLMAVSELTRQISIFLLRVSSVAFDGDLESERQSGRVTERGRSIVFAGLLCGKKVTGSEKGMNKAFD